MTFVTRSGPLLHQDGSGCSPRNLCSGAPRHRRGPRTDRWIVARSDKYYIVIRHASTDSRAERLDV